MLFRARHTTLLCLLSSIVSLSSASDTNGSGKLIGLHHSPRSFTKRGVPTLDLVLSNEYSDGIGDCYLVSLTLGTPGVSYEVCLNTANQGTLFYGPGGCNATDISCAQNICELNAKGARI